MVLSFERNILGDYMYLNHSYSYIIAFISLMCLNLPEPKGILDGISFDHQITSYSKLLYSVLHLMGFSLLYLQMKQRMSTDFNHESYLTFFT